MSKPSPRAKTLRLAAMKLYKDRAPSELAHVLRVARMGGTERQIVVGLFHDAIEDGLIQYTELDALGITSDEALDIENLTRHAEWGETSSENYIKYIWRVRAFGSLDALFVKAHDLLDHLDPWRAAGLSFGRKLRYLKALGLVLDEITAPERNVRDFLEACKDEQGYLARRADELAARKDEL